MSVVISDHIAQAILRLPQQYKAMPVIEGLITAFVGPIQDLEDVFWELSTERWLAVAIGDNLDRIGAIVGQAREGGQSDTDYRARINTRIIQNLSEGEPERVITIYFLLTGALLIDLMEGGYGGVILMSELPIPTQDEVNALAAQIKLVLPATTRLEGIGHFDAVEPFAFDGVLVGEGFGSTTDASVGGKFATLLTPNKPFAFDGFDPKLGGFGTVYDPLVGGSFVGL